MTGQTVLDYFRPRLFEPLGFDSPVWVASPQGISAGAYGLSLRTEEIARFGQLYLQKGVWQGRQVVSASPLEEATARQTSNGSAMCIVPTTGSRAKIALKSFCVLLKSRN